MLRKKKVAAAKTAEDYQTYKSDFSDYLRANNPSFYDKVGLPVRRATQPGTGRSVFHPNLRRIDLANMPNETADLTLSHEYGHRLNSFGFENHAPRGAGAFNFSDTPESNTSNGQLYEELKAWRHGLRTLHAFYESKGYPDAMERTLKHMPQAYAAYDTYLQHAGARQALSTTLPFLNVYSDKTQRLPFSYKDPTPIPAVMDYDPPISAIVSGGVGGAGLAIPATGVMRNWRMRRNLPVNPRVLRSFGKGGLAGGLLGALGLAGTHAISTYRQRNSDNVYGPGQKLLPQDQRMVRGPQEMAKFVFPHLHNDPKTLESIGRATPLQSDMWGGRAPFEINRAIAVH